MSARETIRIAHTAKCKLHLAANHPDRNFRLILGHALTLDKVMLRVAEIESDSTSSEEDEEGVADEEPSGPRTCNQQTRRVSFSAASRARSTVAGTNMGDAKRRSPPPSNHFEHDDDAVAGEEEVDAVEVDDDDEDGALSLQRFPSASAQPPRMIAGEVDEDDDEDDLNEPVSPPSYEPSEKEVKQITGGAESTGLVDLYRSVIKCNCSKTHGTAPKVAKAWEVPDRKGEHGRRVALVQVDA